MSLVRESCSGIVHRDLDETHALKILRTPARAFTFDTSRSTQLNAPSRSLRACVMSARSQTASASLDPCPHACLAWPRQMDWRHMKDVL